MIEVSLEPEPAVWSTIEACCFCRELTRYWFVPKDVACCQKCAGAAEAKDVPSKKVWLRRERIAMGKRDL
jgi:hypothetical protein